MAVKKKLPKAKKALGKAAKGKPVELPKGQSLKLKNEWGNTEKNSVPGINGSEDLIVP